VPKKPGISKITMISLISKIPRVPRIAGVLKSARIPKISGSLNIAGIRKASERVKVPSIPLLAKVPLRTKLILVGCALLVGVSVPVMLSFSSSGEGDDSGEEVVPMQEASANAEQPVAELIDQPEPAEVDTPSAIVEEEPQEPIVPELLSPGTGEAVLEDDPEPQLPAETEVSGWIIEDTTWTAKNSPYIVTDVVRIKSGVTLKIEAGVTVTRESEGDMFLVGGVLQAHGTAANPIIFDGGGNSSFFTAPDFAADSSTDLDYCRIMNGLSLRPLTQLGAFKLKHSRITNVSAPACLWFPERDVHIEYNAFINAAGLSVLSAQDTKIYIQNNLFEGKHSGLSEDADYWIQNRGSFNQSETIVKNNSFSPNDGVALKLLGGHETAAITATDNYWGTQDDNLISGMIYDKTDDDTCAGYINYVPILAEPHPDTPG